MSLTWDLDRGGSGQGMSNVQPVLRSQFIFLRFLLCKYNYNWVMYSTSAVQQRGYGLKCKRRSHPPLEDC